MNNLIPPSDGNEAAAICWLLAGFAIGAIVVVTLIAILAH